MPGIFFEIEEVVQNVRTNPFVGIEIYQKKKLSVFVRKLQRAIIAKLIYARVVKMEDFVISKMRHMILNAFVRFHIMANFVKVKLKLAKK